MRSPVFNVLLLPLLVAPVLNANCQLRRAAAPSRHHWRETEAETLWRDRYNNCDYGYYVLLAKGVVGHDTHSPSPNHGFLVSLPDVGTESFASYTTTDRYILVDASYDTGDSDSLASIANEQANYMNEAGSRSRVVLRKSSQIAGLPAIRFTAEYISPKESVFDEKIVALRHGIIYTVSLHTNESDRAPDRLQYEKIIDGFRLLKTPTGECSNG